MLCISATRVETQTETIPQGIAIGRQSDADRRKASPARAYNEAVGDYDSEFRRLANQVGVAQILAAVVFVALFLTHRVGVMVLMLLLLAALIAIAAYFLVQMTKLRKRFGKP